MALLSKQSILDAVDIQYNTVAVPEWGGEVRIRSLTAADRDSYEQWLMSLPDESGPSQRMVGMRARMASLSVVDEAGERVFSESDIEALNKKSAAALGRVFDAITALNAINAAEVEALAKN